MPTRLASLPVLNIVPVLTKKKSPQRFPSPPPLLPPKSRPVHLAGVKHWTLNRGKLFVTHWKRFSASPMLIALLLLLTKQGQDTFSSEFLWVFVSSLLVCPVAICECNLADWWVNTALPWSEYSFAGEWIQFVELPPNWLPHSAAKALCCLFVKIYCARSQWWEWRQRFQKFATTAVRTFFALRREKWETTRVRRIKVMGTGN